MDDQRVLGQIEVRGALPARRGLAIRDDDAEPIDGAHCRSDGIPAEAAHSDVRV